ncbi:MAG: 5-deoxy-glucuronate isomerase [Desulfopila sp.]
MGNLIVKKKIDSQLTIDVGPESAAWRYVGFKALKLQSGQSYTDDSRGTEICLVIIGGRADVVAGETTFTNIGERTSPFATTPPYSVYLPPGTPYRIRAVTPLEVGICSAADATGAFPIRLIGPKDVVTMERGEGSCLRRINNILMGETLAERLLVTEVFTPGGNWSSYPPHKHDQDKLPRESYLEETYYHRISPAQGFVVQRVYTDDRSLDETMAAADGDCVLVPRGYHPVGVPHGYASYYLNTMAGPHRQWKFHNDPDHEWLLTGK